MNLCLVHHRTLSPTMSIDNPGSHRVVVDVLKRNPVEMNVPPEIYIVSIAAYRTKSKKREKKKID